MLVQMSLFQDSGETIHSAEIDDTEGSRLMRIRSNEIRIRREPSVPHMKANLIFIGENTKYFFFEKPNNQKPKKYYFPALPILNIFSQKFRNWSLGE